MKATFFFLIAAIVFISCDSGKSEGAQKLDNLQANLEAKMNLVEALAKRHSLTWSQAECLYDTVYADKAKENDELIAFIKKNKK